MQQEEELFKNKNVIEIGAGAGLPGLFASTLCKEVVVTDGDEEVVKILDFNVEANELSTETAFHWITDIFSRKCTYVFIQMGKK